mmetsp:Transcript_5535/g.19644  ORF Transcript_5535/g.19644 Transcript_5535/m.19644 type:complete len:164 (+) Transcript_5535:234-725(+)
MASTPPKGGRGDSAFFATTPTNLTDDDEPRRGGAGPGRASTYSWHEALHCARPAPPDDARWASLGRHTDGAGVDTRKPLPRAHSAQAPSDNCAACAAPWQSHDGFFSRGEHSRACRLCQTPYCAYCKREKMVRKRQSLTAADSAAWRCKAACPTPAAAPSVAV